MISCNPVRKVFHGHKCGHFCEMLLMDQTRCELIINHGDHEDFDNVSIHGVLKTKTQLERVQKYGRKNSRQLQTTQVSINR